MATFRPRRPASSAHSRRQRGVMLIEALIAILIFSIGILGIVGLQASAVKQSTDARYRAEAAYLAEQLLGQMWTGKRDVATLTARYASSCGTACTGYATWFNNVQAVLPNVFEDQDTKPEVLISPGGVVTITVKWRAPGDDNNSDPHHYDVEAQIQQ
jgi:type IV pilus assembly protein PilV